MDDYIGLGDGTPANNGQCDATHGSTPRCRTTTRALPDAEIVVGTPIPGVVPLPGKPMPPMPQAKVVARANPNSVCLDPLAGLVAKVARACPKGTVERNTGSLTRVARPRTGAVGNPGYPFWIAGMEHSVGQRPPTPPLDMITQGQAADLQAYGADGVAGTGDEDLWRHEGFDDPGAVHGWDGGLPRFTVGGYSAGSEAIVSVFEPRLDLSKEMTKLRPFFYPEEGTDLEQAAMAFQARREHPTFLSDTVGSTAARFVLNGAPPVPGAPYNEPCIDDKGAVLYKSTEGAFFDGIGGFGVQGKSPFNAKTPRVYKAANVQFDAVFNKLGYHYPQQRIITLWQDVLPTINKNRPPEPMVLRMNTFDCTQYVHSNVVPKAYEVDDYQVRTPTDIIGQHIHLPKWDLTTADGAANGWNYEDGTLSPEAVVEIIHAINAYVIDHPRQAKKVLSYAPNTGKQGDVIDSFGRNVTSAGSLLETDHPYFGARWKGARSTMQRWFADPVVNVEGVDRGLGIIFTHDHYGPSTHQQVGLYATVLVEPAGSKWLHNETGEPLYTRTGSAPAADGGPTSWQAAILTGRHGIGGYTQNVKADRVKSHREFYFEYSDFQHAYQSGVYVGANKRGVPKAKYVFTDSGMMVGGPGQTANGTLLAGQGALKPNPQSFRDAIQPSVRLQAVANKTAVSDEFPVDVWKFPPFCPNVINDVQVNNIRRPCPEAISADDPGMYVVNYRNESLAARIYDPNRTDCPDGKRGCQAEGRSGDLAFAMQTRGDRKFKIPQASFGKPLGFVLNDQPVKGDKIRTTVFPPPVNKRTALKRGDPFTPMMRAYDGDRVHVKSQAGGQEEEFTSFLHGLKWLQSGSGFGEAKNSGWRNAQPGGISEQFTFRSPVFADLSQRTDTADYAYSINASLDGWASGTWGVLRSYRKHRNDLFPLPGNDARIARQILNRNEHDDDVEEDEDENVVATFKGVCPISAPKRRYDVTAVLANDVLRPEAQLKSREDIKKIIDPYPKSHMGRSPDANRRTLVYNPRTTKLVDHLGRAAGQGPLH
ncbi:MAG: hypothetical protein ACR2RL_24235, partial [Gammaproteobacteria bacterium]